MLTLSVIQPASLLFPHFVLGPDPHLTGSYAADNDMFNAGGVIDFTVNHGPAKVTNGIPSRQ